MSEPDSAVHLPSLSREDIKKLEKMAQKAKRDENAKTAKIGPPSYAAVGNSVSFAAPVRVRNDDNERRRLNCVLGSYEDMSTVIMSGKTSDLMGVERQPSTPLPGKKSRSVFNDIGKPGRPVHNVERRSDHPKQTNTNDKGANSKPHDTSKPSSVDNIKQKHTLSSNNTLSHTEHPVPNSHRSDHSRTEAKDSTARGYKPNKTNVQTLPKTDHTDHKQSLKNQSQNREPVLQELGKELTKQKSSSKNSSRQQSSKTSEGTEGQAPVDPISVLQVKEVNRNSPMVNGRVRPRPRLQLPEKNVEDMLKELTQMPQPLTAIQTPLKDHKSPFQDHKSTTKEQTNKDISREGPHFTKIPGKVPTKTVAVKDTARVVEEIQEKDDSSDSSDNENADSSDDNTSDSDKEEEEEEGEIKSDNSENDGHDEKENIKGEPATQQVPQQGSVAMSSVSSMPVKGQREKMSSSESSGSDSDSSEGSASESESDEHEQQQTPEKKTTPKAKMSPDSMDPSPSRQRWALKTFFQPEPQLINIANKPASCEVPASNKLDPEQFDEVTYVKRSDNTSDENIPSVGQDGVNKAMSADEFSPPASVDKCVLSPIKSPQPVKSPAKRRPSAIDKTLKAKGNENHSPYQHNAYDVKHNKDKKGSVMTPSPGLNVSGRGRKAKPKTPVLVVSSSSESDSEPETKWSHLSDSLEKLIPVSPQKSRTVKSKRDKLIKEKDSVKLKKKNLPLDASTKTNSCDRTMYHSASANSRHQESIDTMLDSFPEETPLSPIPNVPNVLNQKADLQKAGLDISPVKPVVPLNGLVQCVNGKPSVIVKLELSLLQKFLPVDFWKTKPHKPKVSLTPKEGETLKSRKLTAVKESIPSHKVLESSSNKESVESNSKRTKSSGSARKNHASDNQSHGKLNVSESVVHASGKSDSVPDFDSLPIREAPVPNAHLSEDSSSESSCSDSEVEETRSRSSCSRLSAPAVDIKKRKGDDHRADDIKRRKTAKSPHKTPVSEVHKQYDDSNWEERQEPQRPRSNKRERHSSSSSQHSTHSYSSTHSRASTSSHKARRTTTPYDTQSHDLKPLSSSSTSLSPGNKKPIKPEPAEPVKENGIAAQSTAQTPCPDSTTNINRTDDVQSDKTVWNPDEMPRYAASHQDPNCLQRQHSADYYHHQAKIYRYQAHKMDAGLPKHLLYLDSVLCFMQCGYAMEKDHTLIEAANMYKDTQKLVIHQCHQYKGHQDPESPELKLTVLCLRIQSLVYLKLYMLKRKETLKLKKALEDHNSKSMKSTSQPKPPSAPSPLQTNWNRSTGTPSPMSPTPSPASVGSVGSVGSDHNTPSKITNGSTGSTAISPSGSVVVPQRIHSITQKYFANSNYLIQAHEIWEQADLAITADIKEFFAQLDCECGPLTLHSSLLHLVKYVKTAVNRLR